MVKRRAEDDGEETRKQAYLHMLRTDGTENVVPTCYEGLDKVSLDLWLRTECARVGADTRSVGGIKSADLHVIVLDKDDLVILATAEKLYPCYYCNKTEMPRTDFALLVHRPFHADDKAVGLLSDVAQRYSIAQNNLLTSIKNFKE